MDRQQMINQMEWLAPDSGTGFGICAVANMFLWAMDEPSADRPDLRSIVAVLGDPLRYTDDEIEALFAFSQEKQQSMTRCFAIAGART